MGLNTEAVEVSMVVDGGSEVVVVVIFVVVSVPSVVVGLRRNLTELGFLL